MLGLSDARLVRLTKQTIDGTTEVNHSFLQDILAKEDCPEFHGYNTKICREQGHLPQINK